MLGSYRDFDPQIVASFFLLFGFFVQSSDFRGKEPELLGRVSKDYMNVYYFKFITDGICVVSDNTLTLSKPWFPFLGQ